MDTVSSCTETANCSALSEYFSCTFDSFSANYPKWKKKFFIFVIFCENFILGHFKEIEVCAIVTTLMVLSIFTLPGSEPFGNNQLRDIHIFSDLT